jgi:hypothetical protein
MAEAGSKWLRAWEIGLQVCGNGVGRWVRIVVGPRIGDGGIPAEELRIIGSWIDLLT